MIKDFFIGLLAILLILNIIFIICAIKSNKDKED